MTLFVAGSTSDKKRTLYSLRHFYATYRLYKGANIHQLAVQMGTSVGMLEKHYSKLTPMLMADEFAGRNYVERESDKHSQKNTEKEHV